MKERLLINQKLSKNKLVFSLCVLLFQIVFYIPAFAESYTKQDIKDAILEKNLVSPDQLNNMDTNKDGKLNVADIVSLINVVNFAVKDSEAYENQGNHSIQVNFNTHYSGTLNFSFSGTAERYTDFSLSNDSINVDGNSATIDLSIEPDTIFEGQETIVINLLPNTDLDLGPVYSHTIIINDNPQESSANYVFILNSESQGIEGNIAEGKGFPSTRYSRTAFVNITFSQENVLSAQLNLKKSTGFYPEDDSILFISASSVEYQSGELNLTFEYDSASESFVSNASITSFDYNNPQLGEQDKVVLHNKVQLKIDNFEIPLNQVSEGIIKGNFTYTISGYFQNTTQPFQEGSLFATMQYSPGFNPDEKNIRNKYQ